MNLWEVRSITVPEGQVKRITAGGAVLWQKNVLPEGNGEHSDTVDSLLRENAGEEELTAGEAVT